MRKLWPGTIAALGAARGMLGRRAVAFAVAGAALVMPASASAAIGAAVQDGTLVVTGSGADEMATVNLEEPGCSTVGSHPDDCIEPLMYAVGSDRNRVTPGAGCRNPKSWEGGAWNDVAYCPVAGIDSVRLSMGGGWDLAGTAQTRALPGHPYYPAVGVPVLVVGGGGNDWLASVTRGPRATLVGGADNDNLEAGMHPDTGAMPNPITAKGGGGSDNIYGGCDKRDRLSGDAGPDRLYAKDGRADDLVAGGRGSDFARLDRSDPSTSIEQSNFTGQCP